MLDDGHLRWRRLLFQIPYTFKHVAMRLAMHTASFTIQPLLATDGSPDAAAPTPDCILLSSNCCQGLAMYTVISTVSAFLLNTGPTRHYSHEQHMAVHTSCYPALYIHVTPKCASL